MIIDRMVSSIYLDTENMTEQQWNKIEWKLASIEKRISMNHIMFDYTGACTEIVVKKPKPYYRKGRWE